MTARFSKKRARPIVAALFFIFHTSLTGCSLMKERPIQLMSDTVSALRAAKEVSADSLAPDLYRRANDAYFRAQNEYRLKNFAIAETYALRAKRLAEEAEVQALQQGSSRNSLLPPEEHVAPPPMTPVSPGREELATEAMKRQDANPTGTNPTPTPTTGTGSSAQGALLPGAQAPAAGSNFAP